MIRKPKARHLTNVAIAAVAIALVVIGLRRTPLFAAWIELPLYDALVTTAQPWPAPAPPPITLVTMTDEAFWRGLDDDRLLELLDRVSQSAPSVILVDLIRDAEIPEPYPPGTARLENLVLHGPVPIIMACGIPGAAGIDGFEPPVFLRTPDRTADFAGLAAMPIDHPGRPMVRRGLVAIHGGDLLSLPAHAALHHLACHHPQDSSLHHERLATISDLPETAGGYAGGLGGGNQFLLKPWPAIERSFPTIAAESIHNQSAETLRELLHGRIVFIGTERILSQDEKPVPGNPDLRGIRLIAAATTQLLDELQGITKPVRWLPDLAEDAIVLLTAMLCAFGCAAPFGPLAVRLVLWIPICLLVILAGGVATLTVAGLWLPVGAPVTATALSGLSAFALTLVHERRQRSLTYQLLEKHLSPEVADAVWRHNSTMLSGHGPPPEMFRGTALFADLKGYSGITEQFLQSGRNHILIDWLNHYLRAVIPAIRDHGGFVQQFAGDGVFVIFGFPPGGERASHATHAVNCAVVIASAVEQLNRLQDPALPPYHVRIGIYTGDIIAGQVGDQAHASYSFFGSTINKAARLESLEKRQHEVASEAVRILASDSTRTEAVPSTGSLIPFSAEPSLLDPNLPPEPVWRWVAPSGKS